MSRSSLPITLLFVGPNILVVYGHFLIQSGLAGYWDGHRGYERSGTQFHRPGSFEERKHAAASPLSLDKMCLDSFHTDVRIMLSYCDTALAVCSEAYVFTA
jgi:hypothetical protein